MRLRLFRGRIRWPGRDQRGRSAAVSQVRDDRASRPRTRVEAIAGRASRRSAGATSRTAARVSAWPERGSPARAIAGAGRGRPARAARPADRRPRGTHARRHARPAHEAAPGQRPAAHALEHSGARIGARRGQGGDPDSTGAQGRRPRLPSRRVRPRPGRSARRARRPGPRTAQPWYATARPGRSAAGQRDCGCLEEVLVREWAVGRRAGARGRHRDQPARRAAAAHQGEAGGRAGRAFTSGPVACLTLITWASSPACRCRPGERPGTRAPAPTATGRSSWARGRHLRRT